jgi:hypothetical protein
MGIAALLPGMQFMLDRMQAELDAMRDHLAVLQQGESTDSSRKNPKRVAGGRSGWSSDPEERSREMRRRRALSKRKKQADGGRKRWAGMSKAAKADWLGKMQAGKAAKRQQPQAEAKVA